MTQEHPPYPFISSTTMLLEQAIGSKVMWRGALTRIVAAGWGMVLVEALPSSLLAPLPSPPLTKGWWVWSAGGGHGLGRYGDIFTEQEALTIFKDVEIPTTQKFWERLLKNRTSSIIAKREHYTDGGDQPSSRNLSYLGFGGHRWYIENLATQHKWTTNNLWAQGAIPKEYDKEYPDTHCFLTQEEYAKPASPSSPSSPSSPAPRPVDQIFPEARRLESIQTRTCVRPPIGCGKPLPTSEPFKDALSAKEYSISGLYQACQDRIFTPASE